MTSKLGTAVWPLACVSSRCSLFFYVSTSQRPDHFSDLPPAPFETVLNPSAHASSSQGRRGDEKGVRPSREPRETPVPPPCESEPRCSEEPPRGHPFRRRRQRLQECPFLTPPGAAVVAAHPPARRPPGRDRGVDIGMSPFPPAFGRPSGRDRDVDIGMSPLPALPTPPAAATAARATAVSPAAGLRSGAAVARINHPAVDPFAAAGVRR